MTYEDQDLGLLRRPLCISNQPTVSDTQIPRSETLETVTVLGSIFASNEQHMLNAVEAADSKKF